MYDFEVIEVELCWVDWSLETEVEEEGCRLTESECALWEWSSKKEERPTVEIGGYFIPFPQEQTSITQHIQNSPDDENDRNDNIQNGSNSRRRRPRFLITTSLAYPVDRYFTFTKQPNQPDVVIVIAAYDFFSLSFSFPCFFDM